MSAGVEQYYGFPKLEMFAELPEEATMARNLDYRRKYVAGTAINVVPAKLIWKQYIRCHIGE